MPDYQFLGPVVVALGRNTPDGVVLLGTGFGIRTGLIGTAAHVAGHDDSNLVAVLPHNADPNAYQDTTNSQLRIIPLRIKQFDPIKDLALLEASGLNMNAQIKIEGTDAAPPRSPVVTYGFPHTDTGRMVLTMHSALVGARVLLGSANLKVKHLVLNIQTRTGQSGSPVMIDDKLVAIVTGAYRPPTGGAIIIGNIDPATLHQTTHAVSAEYLKEML